MTAQHGAHETESGEVATFGCVLAINDRKSRAQLDVLCQALGEALSLVVEPRPMPSQLALAEAFAAGQVELVWASPTLALRSPAMRQAFPVVRSVREGLPHYHSVLFVRKDSPIRSPMQLPGARAAWIDPSSASGYIFPRIALVGYGLDPATLFASETFYDSHGAAAQAVVAGEADVGATYAAFEHGDATRPLLRAGFSGVTGLDTMRILLTTPPIPSDLVLASPAMWFVRGEALVEALERLSLQPDARAAIRQVLGADGFIRCDARALDELRRQIADADALELINAG